jgi:EAL domain-containing protein (putative c-di-GMP-specific phosphodiesterase class I)
VPFHHYQAEQRLNDKDNTISPDAFIPAAERYGIMPSIDRWVVEHSFAFMQKLQSSPADVNKNIIFSINISGSSLGEKKFFLFIKEKLSYYNIPPESICFEITETATITNLSIALDFMHNVKALGCSLALDDFGSGLCSFTYLKTIPVNYLKIDGAFVTQILDNPLDYAQGYSVAKPIPINQLYKYVDVNAPDRSVAND